MIEIDGINGGGQVLRSALSLSMVTGQPFRMINIRGRRSKPGLRRQHLTCVKAAMSICDGSIDGLEMDSQEIIFNPCDVVANNYEFAIGTAGSSNLVFQTLLPALMLTDSESSIRISGGTHNPLAPSADFISEIFLPTTKHFGVDADLKCERVGFAPAGGGAIVGHIRPSKLKSYEILDRGEITNKRIKAMCLNVSGEIMQREVKAALKKLAWEDADITYNQIVDGDGSGNCFSIQIDNEFVSNLITEYGRLGTTSERVAANAVKSLNRYLKSTAAVGEQLADQLILPMALAGGGAITVQRLSNHLKTNIAVVEQFLDIKFDIESLENHILISL